MGDIADDHNESGTAEVIELPEPASPRPKLVKEILFQMQMLDVERLDDLLEVTQMLVERGR